MLKLKKVCKYYQVGKNKKVVLDNITLDFKDHELVFILGASGSGKSTLLNIIGGNLRCDSGEIWLDGDCISNYTDKELDKYRGMIIGNIFQDYNLIDYIYFSQYQHFPLMISSALLAVVRQLWAEVQWPRADFGPYRTTQQVWPI